MKTRKVRLQFTPEGFLRPFKTATILPPEKVLLRETFGEKILACLQRAILELHSQPTTSLSQPTTGLSQPTTGLSQQFCNRFGEENCNPKSDPKQQGVTSACNPKEQPVTSASNPKVHLDYPASNPKEQEDNSASNPKEQEDNSASNPKEQDNPKEQNQSNSNPKSYPKDLAKDQKGEIAKDQKGEIAKDQKDKFAKDEKGDMAITTKLTLSLLAPRPLKIHLMLQIWNSLCYHLPNVQVRSPVIRQATCLTESYLKTVESLTDLAHFREELLFHIEIALNTICVFVLNYLETANSSQLAVVFEEWYRHNLPYREHILRYPQLIYPFIKEFGVTRASVGSAKPRKGKWLFGAGSRSEPQGGRSGHRVNRTSERTSKRTSLLVSEASLVNEVTGSLFGVSDRLGDRVSDRLGDRVSAPWWSVADSALSIYRRHVQILFSVRKLFGVLVGEVGVVPSGLTEMYETCPLFYGRREVLRTDNGVALRLGIELQGGRAYVCRMAISGEEKRRLFMPHQVFFLLVRPKERRREVPTLEVSCIHPLWNVQVLNLDPLKFSCTIAVTWQPHRKAHRSPRDCSAYDVITPTVTDFELIFEDREKLSKVVSTIKAQRSALCKASAKSLRKYFLERD